MIVSRLDPVQVVDGDLWVHGGRVAEPGSGTRIATDGLLVVPGNVCAHTHLYSALARGMPYTLEPPRNFLEILQRIWWRLDRALDEDLIHASALVGGMEALLSGTTTLVDHHASPNSIPGSLDVIEQALGSIGIRSVLCYETSDRDGPERATAGVAENRRFLERVRHEQPQLVRAMVGAHASFTLSDETLLDCAEVGPLHVHAAEDGVDHGAVARLASLGALDERTLLAHGVHLGAEELALVRSTGATVAHNARSNMNNAVGRARIGLLGARLALGTDGIGADMFEESRTAFFRLREDDLGAGPDWPLARLAESARLAGRVFGEPLLGTLETGAPADLVVLDYAAPVAMRESTFAGHWVFGLSSRCVRDVMVGGEWVVRDRRLALADEAELAASPARRPGACGCASPRPPPTGSSRKESGDGRRDWFTRSALSAGQAPDPRRHALRPARRGGGVRSRLAGGERLVREATVPMAAYAAVTDRIVIGSGVVNTWTRNVGLLAATFSTLDDLAPGRIRLGLGAWWEPLASKVGVHRHHPLRAMRETVEATRRLLAMERVTYHGDFVHLEDVEIDIVHGDRTPKHVPIYVGATGMKMMELAGEIGDGVLLNYLVGPGYNRDAMAALAAGAERAGRTVDDLDGRSSSSAPWTRTARSRSTGHASSSRSTSGSSRTS